MWHTDSREAKPTCEDGGGSGSLEKTSVTVVASLDTFTAASSAEGVAKGGGRGQYVNVKRGQQLLHGLER